ncbi:MAG: hypothetical protein CRU78_01595 [Candidatus Accumulibacter phosphatis]|uniref:Uncharacterized protein n=1 Tax=Candidatus Accumulibacter phosphatis TaxID=327160 RepID=A0A6A7RQ27_9PROT|nr:hypothetical protein [Candidatus Accumulibacter phosphatis]
MREIKRSASSRAESEAVRSDGQVSHLPPERMTPEQRRIEIALLLANGLARLRSAGEPVARENGFELAFSGHQRVHSHPVNKK